MSIGVFEKALNYFRMSAPELKEERAMLLDEWLDMERSFGQLGDVSLVEPKLPKKLKKRKQIASEDGLAGYVIYLCFYLLSVDNIVTKFYLLSPSSVENTVTIMFSYIMPKAEVFTSSFMVWGP